MYGKAIASLWLYHIRLYAHGLKKTNIAIGAFGYARSFLS